MAAPLKYLQKGYFAFLRKRAGRSSARTAFRRKAETR